MELTGHEAQYDAGGAEVILNIGAYSTYYQLCCGPIANC